MAVNQINNVQNQEVETLPFDSENNKKNSSNSSLHQVFKNDSVDGKATSSQKVVLEDKTPTFWNRIAAWFNPIENSPTSAVTEPSKPPQPISMVPVLDEPEEFSELETTTLPPVVMKKNAKQTLSSHEVMEAVSLMSEHTIEEIMCIVTKGQLELEKENAAVGENTYAKYQQIRKLREKILEEIKETLMKDEKVLAWCKTAQNIALVASCVCGLAAAFFTGGAAVPVSGVIGSIVGNSAASSIVWVGSLIGTYGLCLTAGGAAVTTAGTKFYAQRQLNESKAQHDLFGHQDKYTSDRIEDVRQKLMSISKSDEAFKERLINLSKRLAKMSQLVMQK